MNYYEDNTDGPDVFPTSRPIRRRSQWPAVPKASNRGKSRFILQRDLARFPLPVGARRYRSEPDFTGSQSFGVFETSFEHTAPFHLNLARSFAAMYGR